MRTLPRPLPGILTACSDSLKRWFRFKMYLLFIRIAKQGDRLSAGGVEVHEPENAAAAIIAIVRAPVLSVKHFCSIVIADAADEES